MRGQFLELLNEQQESELGMRRELTQAGDIPEISLTLPVYLPYISRISPVYLPYISRM